MLAFPFRIHDCVSVYDVLQLQMEEAVQRCVELALKQRDRIDRRKIDADTFTREYLARNRPVILQGLCGDWKATKHFVERPTAVACASASVPSVSVSVSASVPRASACTSRPAFSFWKTQFGSAVVPVAECANKSYTDQKRTSMTVFDFFSRWEEGKLNTCENALYLKVRCHCVCVCVSVRVCTCL